MDACEEPKFIVGDASETSDDGYEDSLSDTSHPEVANHSTDEFETEVCLDENNGIFC